MTGAPALSPAGASPRCPFAELRALLGLDVEALDVAVVHDSQTLAGRRRARGRADPVLRLHRSLLVELLAAGVVDRADRILEEKRPRVRRTRARVEWWIAEQDGAVTRTPPAGGACGIPRVHAVPGIEAFCHRLAREQRVLLVPGTCFGVAGHIRLGFGGCARRWSKDSRARPRRFAGRTTRP